MADAVFITLKQNYPTLLQFSKIPKLYFISYVQINEQQWFCYRTEISCFFFSFRDDSESSFGFSLERLVHEIIAQFILCKFKFFFLTLRYLMQILSTVNLRLAFLFYIMTIEKFVADKFRNLHTLNIHLLISKPNLHIFQ